MLADSPSLLSAASRSCRTQPSSRRLRTTRSEVLLPTGHGAAVAVVAARGPGEVPAVGAVAEGEVEHPEGVGLAGDAVGGEAPEGVEADAPGAHHEGLDAVGVRAPGLVLEGEALVVVVVALQQD